ncbi:hypothetical protein FB468_0993 [Leucobacter komagatae]|uniref:Uncharacterized protein n=2 Tax=Leucobacter komagatae TaxID=55969 RepID=A0A542Y4I9_9MICO|nr:hypothetical protein FB468_0993 [Leucobacter komagatae]
MSYSRVTRFKSDGVQVVKKRPMPKTRRAKKIIAGMEANGCVIKDAEQAKWRVCETSYTFERPLLSGEELKSRGWQK